MKAVISVIGKDAVGILAKVSAICAESNANVTEVTQSVLQDVFAMVMLVDITSLSTPLAELSDKMTELGREFIAMDTTEPKLFYIWGHAYEMDYDSLNWHKLEEFFKLISGHEDIFYGTNTEVLLDK